ncbi:MAG TPA: hypothetical protein VHZ51_19485 [Ktedonobacteraceae bacterium]|jgi:hypothetical protein|nr:hypothetical protein [Ktedonobacteraceae bacterium]
MDDDLLRMYKKAFSMNEGAFRNEAALRDIFVLETDGQDWQTFLPFLHASPYPVECLIDGEPRPLPERVEDLFAYSLEHPIIRIDEVHLAVHCYCFAEQGMEFDIAAKDFQDETTFREQIARLLDFIRTIGRVLNKVIILAPEGSPGFPLFRFDPSTEEEHWFREHLEAME